MAEEGRKGKLSWDEWHQLHIRSGSDWQRQIDALPAAIHARLAQGVVNGDGFAHVEQCVSHARHNVVAVEEIAAAGHQNKGEAGRTGPVQMPLSSPAHILQQ